MPCQGGRAHPSFEVLGPASPEKASRSLQASGGGGAGAAALYARIGLFPKFIPQKMGLLHFETLHTFTFDGAFVQLLYFEKESSGWGMYIRLKQALVFWTLLKVTSTIHGKESPF